VLSSHNLGVWLDIAYSIAVKSYYMDAVYLHRWGALRWCIDSPCGGSITGSLVRHLSFFGVNINVGLSSLKLVTAVRRGEIISYRMSRIFLRGTW
jgi:hypothetical protein